LVSCRSYHGPTLWHTEPRPGYPDGVPVIPVTAIKSTFEHGGKAMSRTKLPLRLAWAVTVHKSQGTTLSKARIGLGTREFCSSLTFVALSRVKDSLDLLLINQGDFNRV
ncbi:hypothetical protein GLOTRDRAFT_4877, partial [Gloeophyllum trabeum ATCC 11539]